MGIQTLQDAKKKNRGWYRDGIGKKQGLVWGRIKKLAKVSKKLAKVSKSQQVNKNS